MAERDPPRIGGRKSGERNKTKAFLRRETEGHGIPNHGYDKLKVDELGPHKIIPEALVIRKGKCTPTAPEGLTIDMETKANGK